MTSVRKRLPLIMAVTVFATPAIAQSELEKQLAIAMGGDAPASEAPKGKTPAPEAKGWVIPNDGSNVEAPCSMTYRDGANVMGYLGPFKGWDESYFLAVGPNIPPTRKPRSIMVTLATDSDSNQTVRAFNYPAGNGEHAILFKLTDLNEALDAMGDQEDIAIILMEQSEPRFKQSVFAASWSDGHAARDRVRACLAMQD